MGRKLRLETHMGQPRRTAGKADRIPKPGGARVLDFTAAKLRRDYVAAADALPGGRKSLGRAAWKAKNAAKQTYTPGRAEMRGLAADARELVAAGCGDEAALMQLAFNAILPALRELHAQQPLAPTWALFCTETLAQGDQDRAIARFLETGSEEDRDAAMQTTLRHAAAGCRLYDRLLLDSSRVALGESVPALPAHVTALIRQVRTDGGAA